MSFKRHGLANISKNVSATPSTASRSRSPSTRWGGKMLVPWRAPRRAPIIEPFVSVSPPAVTQSNSESMLMGLRTKNIKVKGRLSKA
jgi:hypothetical protein